MCERERKRDKAASVEIAQRAKNHTQHARQSHREKYGEGLVGRGEGEEPSAFVVCIFPIF